jgi:phenylacetate-CoA ligase
MITDRRGISSGAPLWFKTCYRYFSSLLDPYPHRINRGAYRETAALLRETGRFDSEQILEYQSSELRRLIEHCTRTVPYYREMFRSTGILPGDISSSADLPRLPLLDKDRVREVLPSLLSEIFSPADRHYESTGGTSGRPLAFYSLRGYSSQRELAFWHDLAGRTGYRPGDRLAVLRNDSLPGKRLFVFNPRTCQLVLDPFKLTSSNAALYVGAMRSYRTRFLHTYPSGVTVLLRFARDAGVDVRGVLTAVLCGSENVYEGQRELIEEGFGARFFSWYGHSEKLVLAGECEFSHNYHSYPEYGILELVDGRGNPVTESGIRAEIVGTGFNNPVMPLLRYRTGDYAEWAPDQACRCGRPHPIIRNVAGRWLQEMVLGRSGSLISITSINMHTDAFDRVMKFQFLQEEKGRLALSIVKGEGFSLDDAAGIREAILGKVGSELDVEVRIVDEIPATTRGKHRFLIQRLPIPDMEPRDA